uniref:Uncharacterized protein n=1 Tax=Rhizophora mucronata TaxID=61149 RepID=A0A2P2IX80_RHIMU
MICNGNYP